MNNTSNNRHRSILQKIARRVMLDKGLYPDFSPRALAELGKIKGPVLRIRAGYRDLRNLTWCSIDNDDSLDLDQLTAAEAMPGGNAKIFVAIADVDALVRKNSALDGHAKHNTASVYTAGVIFPMLPEKLSNGLTSLNPDTDRPAMVVEMVIGADGSLKSSEIYEALVRNHAKLTYNSVANWLEGGQIPQEINAVDGLAENLRLHDRVAQQLKALRHESGALDLKTIETRPVFEGDILKDLSTEESNRATGIIEDFMIAANGVTARFLASKKFPSVRRVVRTPKRWDRIVSLAADLGWTLPGVPSPKALEKFLESQEAADPVRFPDLSLSIIKLLGSGEYIVKLPGHTPVGHFGLAVRDYAHSTAPNRRFPDLLTQRLLKAAVAGHSIPYSINELNTLAKHCTEMEDTVKKVERQVDKSAAALLLERRLGDEFDAIVTGVSDKGTWVRIIRPPVEGKLVRGFKGLDVGKQVRVWLERANVRRGFIDFRIGDLKTGNHPKGRRKKYRRWKRNHRRRRRRN